MFKWLVNLFITTPYGGSSCACCEGQKEELRKMQRAIEKGEVEENEKTEDFFADSFHMSCSITGGCRSQEYHAKILGDLSNGSSPQELSEEIHKFKK